MKKARHIPVIDLFAGPGGLGEGFSALRDDHGVRPFRIGLSIEKNALAHATLHLRSFFRQFGDAPPSAYYDALRQQDQPLPSRLKSLFGAHPIQTAAADSEAWHAELGQEGRESVRERIAASIGEANPWVLLGGPPCQAYSVAGRSRNKGNPGYKAENDTRQFLYVEYLHVIAEHQPAVFVMENVKGLLSATVNQNHIFERILGDLKAPVAALRRDGHSLRVTKPRSDAPQYRVFSITQPEKSDGSAQDFVVEMERFGIPQARHRLILLGVRSDVLGSTKPQGLVTKDQVAAKLVLDGLPPLRSGLSREADSDAAWLRHLGAARDRRWFSASAKRAGSSAHLEMLSTLDDLVAPEKGRGGEFVPFVASAGFAEDWYLDSRLGGVCNHRTREHMVEDLYRYFYCAHYGRANLKSPVLSDFPADLLPERHSGYRPPEAPDRNLRPRLLLAPT